MQKKRGHLRQACHPPTGPRLPHPAELCGWNLPRPHPRAWPGCVWEWGGGACEVSNRRFQREGCGVQVAICTGCVQVRKLCWALRVCVSSVSWLLSHVYVTMSLWVCPRALWGCVYISMGVYLTLNVLKYVLGKYVCIPGTFQEILSVPRKCEGCMFICAVCVWWHVHGPSGACLSTGIP